MGNYVILKKLQEGKLFLFFKQNMEVKKKKMLIASPKISEREGSISPSSFYGQLPDY